MWFVASTEIFDIYSIFSIRKFRNVLIKKVIIGFQMWPSSIKRVSVCITCYTRGTHWRPLPLKILLKHVIGIGWILRSY